MGALSYIYQYSFASELHRESSGFGLRLATSGGAEPNPHFFRGRIAYPRETAVQLLSLAQVVGSRFYIPGAPKLADPVVTANDGMLRFEAFSSCCGVYARADMRADSFEADLHGRGTTNVDFNATMRAALSQVRDGDHVNLSVGAEGLTIEKAGHAIVEKKVKLPIRWVKGFAEVQAYQPTLTRRFEVSAAEARLFVRSLPRSGGARQPAWVTPLGKGLRLSQRQTPGAVRVVGTDRLQLLDPLLPLATSLVVWSDDGAGTSAWELRFRTGRYVLMISPEPSRGFSGEGQMLTRLAGSSWEAALPHTRAALAWQARVDPDVIARSAGVDRVQVEGALAVLGARGLVGYDAAEGAYFHRELPFDLDAVEKLQPRLKDARKLVAENKVRITERSGTGDSLTAIALVQGTDVEHYVRLQPTGDRCSCPWYSKNQGDRGACKHVLAARIVVDGEDAE